MFNVFIDIQKLSKRFLHFIWNNLVCILIFVNSSKFFADTFVCTKTFEGQISRNTQTFFFSCDKIAIKKL